MNNAGKAAKSGVREGFLIESINSAPVDHLTSNEAQALIRNSGDTLTIGVNRFVKLNLLFKVLIFNCVYTETLTFYIT